MKFVKEKYFTGGSFDPNMLMGLEGLLAKKGQQKTKLEGSDIASGLAGIFAQLQDGKQKRQNTSYSKADTATDVVSNIGMQAGKFTPTGSKISAGGAAIGNFVQGIGGDKVIGYDIDGNPLKESKYKGLDAIGGGIKAGAAGAEIGSLAGPLGTAVGGAVGFAAGTVASAIGGRNKRKKLKESADLGAFQRSFLAENKIDPERLSQKLDTQNKRMQRAKFGIAKHGGKIKKYKSHSKKTKTSSFAKGEKSKYKGKLEGSLKKLIKKEKAGKLHTTNEGRIPEMKYPYQHKYRKGGTFKQVGEEKQVGDKLFVPLMYAQQTGGYNPNVDPNQPQTGNQQLSKIDSQGRKVNAYSAKGNALNDFLQKQREQFDNSDKYKYFKSQGKNIVAAKYKGKWYTIGEVMDKPTIPPATTTTETTETTKTNKEPKPKVGTTGKRYHEVSRKDGDWNIQLVEDMPNGGKRVLKKGLLRQDTKSGRADVINNLKNFGVSDTDIDQIMKTGSGQFSVKGAQQSVEGKDTKTSAMNKEIDPKFLEQLQKAVSFLEKGGKVYSKRKAKLEKKPGGWTSYKAKKASKYQEGGKVFSMEGDNNYEYIVDGGKYFTRKKGTDKWIDISNNKKAVNILNNYLNKEPLTVNAASYLTDQKAKKQDPSEKYVQQWIQEETWKDELEKEEAKKKATPVKKYAKVTSPEPKKEEAKFISFNNLVNAFRETFSFREGGEVKSGEKKWKDMTSKERFIASRSGSKKKKTTKKYKSVSKSKDKGTDNRASGNRMFKYGSSVKKK